MRIERLARSRGGTPIQNIDTVLASTELGITVSRKTIRCPAVPLWTALIGCAHLPRGVRPSQPAASSAVTYRKRHRVASAFGYVD